MYDLILSGVFERHPRLRVAIVEFELARECIPVPSPHLQWGALQCSPGRPGRTERPAQPVGIVGGHGVVSTTPSWLPHVGAGRDPQSPRCTGTTAARVIELAALPRKRAACPARLPGHTRGVSRDPQRRSIRKPLRAISSATLGEDGPELGRLLASFEAVLPLREPSGLGAPAMRAHVLGRSEGTTGEIVAVLTAATDAALSAGEERIVTLDAAEYQPPSVRRRLFERELQ